MAVVRPNEPDKVVLAGDVALVPEWLQAGRACNEVLKSAFHSWKLKKIYLMSQEF